MTINANIKSDACSPRYTAYILRGFPGAVFRCRHLQFILSLSSYFISPSGNRRKRTNTNMLFWNGRTSRNPWQ
jgi:hypothetical protein